MALRIRLPKAKLLSKLSKFTQFPAAAFAEFQSGHPATMLNPVDGLVKPSSRPT